MDPKQDLTPELKEIYNRVMNTPTKPPTPATTSQPPQPKVTLPPQTPQQIAKMPSEAVQPQASLGQTEVQGSSAPSPLAPRPISDKPFVFTNKGTSPITTSAASLDVKTSKGVPALLVILGIIAFIVVYAVVWLRIFNFF